jgi:hypothetical protein
MHGADRNLKPLRDVETPSDEFVIGPADRYCRFVPSCP